MPAGPTGPRTESGISSNSIRREAILARHIQADLYAARYFKGVWPSHQPLLHAGDGYTVPTGTDTQTAVAVFPGPFPLSALYYFNGTQTIKGPVHDPANGWLEIGLDSALGEGVEYVFGGSLDANNPLANVVGSEPGMILKATLQPQTVANIAEMALGFRKAAAFAAAIDNYTDMAVLNVQYDTTAAFVRIETILNNATTVTVETGLELADATDIVLEVWLMGRKVRLFVNGVEFKSTFQFDLGDSVIPFLHWLQVTGGSELRMKALEVGPLWHLKKDINRR
jgi:hypothetical protein